MIRRAQKIVKRLPEGNGVVNDIFYDCKGFSSYMGTEQTNNTHAIQHPRSPIDHKTMYHTNPTADSATRIMTFVKRG